MNVYYDNKNQVTNFDGNTLTINNEKYSDNLMLTNESVNIIDIISIEDINEVFILNIIKLKPDIVIFGTGNNIKYIKQDILYLLQKNNIGVEVMAIAPLCRTYNFLLSEDRKVIAIVIFDKD